MNSSLLDTDTLSEVLKAKDARVIAHARTYHATFGRYTLSVVTVMEVVKGLHKLGQPQRLAIFLAHLNLMDVLTFDTTAAETAGRIYADLEKTGQPIGRADPMIAAVALCHGLTLVTGNVAHYQRIQTLGYPLVIANWRV